MNDLRIPEDASIDFADRALRTHVTAHGCRARDCDKREELEAAYTHAVAVVVRGEEADLAAYLGLDDPAYVAHLEAEERLVAAGIDPSMPTRLMCYVCEVERYVEGYGAVVNDADPTQTYLLTCGHVTM